MEQFREEYEVGSGEIMSGSGCVEENMLQSTGVWVQLEWLNMKHII